MIALASVLEDSLLQRINEIAGVTVRFDVDAKTLTTIGVGGRIRTLFVVETLVALQALLRTFASAGSGLSVLGGGSNSLFPDGDYLLPIVRLGGEFKEFRKSSATELEIGAAMGLMRLARLTAREGLSGLEFAGGIPATIGGAIAMNAGAHGGEIGDRVSSVRCLTADGEMIRLTPMDLRFGYRHSQLPVGAIIVGCTMRLAASERDRAEKELAENLDYRKRTQPLSLPSFGSTFRNPSEDSHLPSAGQLIEDVGLKGCSRGGASISTLHGNWVVNPSRTATCQDVISLMSTVKKKVLDRFQV
ncbi:MAG: UDP-N-acetylmuramate dehydrogenase, partial [Bdellovibrionales bacterium]|nr:UDP-N-acetylmuramate dehydrogenase [Bdellovibrionales bacterium]